MTRLLTASSLQRIAVCAASAVLPKVDSVNERAERGQAIHVFLENVLGLGPAEAIALVPEEHRPACAAIDLEALPLDAAQWAAEVAYAFDVATGRAREIGRSIGRDYGSVGADEIVGTADVVGIFGKARLPRSDIMHSADRVFILDYKTGRTEVTRASRNWQLRYLALAASRAYGASFARVGLIHIHDDGTVLYDTAALDAFELDAVAEDLGAVHRRVKAAAAELAAGRPPAATTGDHCRWCPCLAYCPAQTALVRTVAGEVDEGRELTPALTPETAARAWERVKSIKAAVKRAESALHTWAAGHPIALPSGLVLGPVETTREGVDGAIARAVLSELHGWEVADKACDWSTSKAAVERALRGIAAVTGGKITHLKAAALYAIRAAGGITTTTTTSVREHVPDNRAAVQVAADMAALAASLE